MFVLKDVCSSCLFSEAWLALIPLDLPKSSWKKGIDDLSRAVHSWITQLDGRTVFGTADGTFDHKALPMGDKILYFSLKESDGGKPTLKHKWLYVKTNIGTWNWNWRHHFQNSAPVLTDTTNPLVFKFLAVRSYYKHRAKSGHVDLMNN